MVAPETSLPAEGLVGEALGTGITRIALLGVDEGGKPQVGSGVGPPALEIEIGADVGRMTVGTIEAHDVVILIFHPDASGEATFAALAQRSNVKYQTANLAQKFPVNVLELVMLTVEPRGVYIDHLEETAGDETDVDELAPILGQLPLEPGIVFEQFELHGVGQPGAAEKVFVAVGNDDRLFIEAEVLDVGFNQRRKLA